MAQRNWLSAGRNYLHHVSPTLIDCNFVVDPTNGNGLGLRNLKGPCVQNAYFTSVPGGPPPGSPSLGTSYPYAILAYAAITGSTGGGSTVTGNMGIYPNNGSSITNFPPSVDIGTVNAGNAAANQAIIDATAAYTDLSTRSSTTIASELGGQTLNAGVYSFASGSAQITGGLTLTFHGSATDIFVIQTASTLTTGVGAGGQPVIAFTGGALPSNVFWAVGSSATINSAVSSAGATFYGTVIAQASITATQAGTIDGRLFALTGAVTLSNTNTLTAPTPPLAATGVLVVQLTDAYYRSLTGFSAIASPVSGTPLKIDNSALTPGVAYIITTLGNSTQATWTALGVPAGVSPAVGVSFIAASNGGSANVSTSRVMAPAIVGSGVNRIETIGDPNQSVNPNPSAQQGFGSQFIFQCRDYNGNPVLPVAGSVISLGFLLNSSSITVQGE